MNKLLFQTLVLILTISLLAGCSSADPGTEGSSGTNNGIANTSEATEATFPQTDEDMFTEGDTKTQYEENRVVTISLDGTTASASSDSVRISGSTVTVTEEATYLISGTLTDGMLIVNGEDNGKIHLIFDGVSITSSTSAALYVPAADKVFLTLAEGSVNTLANGGSFTPIDNSNIDAALFSRQDITLNGTGSLTVSSPVGHGIVCKDDLVITGGSYTISCAAHGLDANDSIRIADAVFTIDAGKDALHAENSDDPSLGFIYMESGTLKAEAEGDGLSAGAYLRITGGTLDLLTGGGSENGTKTSSDSYGGFMGGGPGGGPGGMWPGGSEDSASGEDGTSMKGLKAVGDLLISGGSISINSADDSIHSDASLTINGGTFSLVSGDDAIHAEDTLTVAGGEIAVSECYEGLEALHVIIQGGKVQLTADDDGLNAAGGADQSGTEGGRDGMFGGGMGGGRPGMSSSSNGSVRISGGTLEIHAFGDGLDANGSIEISGGHITVICPSHGDTATLDYDGSCIITGGTFIGTGALGMAQTFSDSQQGVIALSVGNQAAGTTILLKDAGGNTLIEHSPDLNFAVVILSSPDVHKGETYTVTVGSGSGSFEAS